MKVTKNVENESPVSNTLIVGTKFQSLAEMKSSALDHALLLAKFCRFYVRDTVVGHYNKQNDHVLS